ncbi:MAG: response regulator, partial [Bacteroidales bacterium]|nr:response regulator [Bacteroidales bacterium]
MFKERGEMVNSNNLKVTLIEDSLHIGEWIKENIETMEGLELADWEKDGENAVSRVQEIKPDIIILDLNLPGMKGLDILQQLRSKSAKPLIIVFTINELARKKVLEMGADYFFDKALEDQDLLKTLGTLGRLNL